MNYANYDNHDHPQDPPYFTSTQHRINEYLISINADPNSTLRPTEAQLRWSSFQRAERVRDTKARIERLMFTPAEVGDVRGAYPSDGESSVDDCDVAQSQAVEATANKNAYLGMRRDGKGKWVRRHFSQKRFPHLAKAVPSPSRVSTSYASSTSCDAFNEQSANRPCINVKKKKVQISKGRRALLRVSARAYDERKRQMSSPTKRQPPSFYAQNISSPPNTPQENDILEVISAYSKSIQSPSIQSTPPEETSKTKSKRKKKKKHKVVFENTPDLDSPRNNSFPINKKYTIEDEISGLFTTSTKSSLRRRPSHASTGDEISTEEEERIRRFESAYRAILLASTAADYEDEATIVSSEWMSSGCKRWSRSVSSAISIDGRSYVDLQRTPTFSRREILGEASGGGNVKCSEPLFDRGASWMVHVPRKTRECEERGEEVQQSPSSRGRAKERQNVNRNVLMSPGQKKLNDIEASIHSIQVGFDLMANRRAVVSPVVGMAMVRREGVGNGQQSVAVGSDDSGRGQSGSREAAMEVISPNFVSSSSARKQTSVTSTREINLQNNGVSLRNESFKSRDTPRAGKKVDTNFADKSSTSNNTRRVNETPPTSTVRTSTLRLLFSGISDTPVKSHSYSSIPTSRDKSKVTGIKEQFESLETVMPSHKSSYSTNNKKSDDIEVPNSPQDRTKVSGMKQHFERQESLGYLTSRPDPIASVFSRTCSYSADNKDSDEADAPILQQERSEVSGIKQHFERQESLGYLTSRPDPIASVFSRTYSYSADNNDSDEVDVPILRQERSKVTGMRERFEQNSTLEPIASDFRNAPGYCRNYKLEDARYGHSLSSPGTRDGYQDSIAQNSDAVEYNNQYGPSSPRNFNLDHLDVANLVRQSLYQKSDSSIIDTDGTSTDITGGYDEEYIMSSLLMSPALITKRYLQALQAIELRNWDQVMYLINADPWLMEMKDLRNDQFLVHVLALFGAGQYDDDEEAAQPAPKELIETMLEHDPSVAHKLDYEGNLPLHMAAASGNIAMIRELGTRFAGAASVQNHDGFLPLHLAIMSCALFPTGEEAVSLILELFDGGVCVKDNDGNTPLHTAARTLKGDVGVDVIYQLMAVCHNLADNDPVQLRESMGGNIKKPKQFDDSATVITTTTDHSTDATGLDDSFPGSLFCLTKNNSGDTPLARAIKSLAGWQVIEALLSMDGGHLAALEKNRASQNALHLSLEIDFNDASAVLAILKAVPSAASIADGSGILPIQLACMNCLQREIILAIAIIDLPIDLGARQEAILREGYGASWWFLVCESDDRYVDIVTEILSMCSHPQKTALCLTRVSYSGINKSAIVGATPKCKIALMGSLRFLGRFEFGDQNMIELSCESTHQFSAIDYGTHETPFDGGRKVSLRCYMNDIDYLKETQHLHQAPLDEMLFEDLDFFSLTECEPNTPHDIRVKHCVSITTPSMSLARVIAGMPKNHKYRRDANSLGRYFGKVKHILLQTAKALSHLHEIGIVHGNVDSSHIGKFGDKWRLTGLLGSCVTGSKLPSHCVGLHSPPEVLLSDDSILALPFIDVWSFGKLMYEVFVGDSLFTPFQQDGDETITIISWNESHQTIIADELFQARIGSVGIDLITGCLNPRDQDRPDTMLSVVHHPFWNDANAFDIH